VRNDSVGLFWEDEPTKKERGANAPRTLAPIPETGWRPPTFLPDLSAARVISLDCETWDPELVDYKDAQGNEVKGKGPGWARGVGHIVGVSIGADGGGRWYFPMRHTVEPEYNWDPEVVLAWLREQLGRPHQPKVGANIIYDVGWLQQEGVRVRGILYDVQSAEALLDERAKVSLETLGVKYLNEGKDSNTMYEWLARSYGGPVSDVQRKNIWRCPPRLVGPYAESDADLPLRVIERQWPLLVREGLLDLFHMECKLTPLLIAMRFAGVRVHLGRAEELYDLLVKRAAEANVKLDMMAGSHVDVNRAETIARAFDACGVPYPKTAKGAPSFRKDFLEKLEHPIGVAIREVRKLEKLAGTFVQSYILNAHRNSMIYGQFHALRGDKNGTRSGRLSGSNPNLQNLPSRDEELAPMVRGLFIPDEGHKQWRRYDYSQIEYRFLIHFAVGPGSDDVRAFFNAHPETDYHDMTLDMVAPVAGWDVSTKELRKHRRKPLKNINFGLIYGMGLEKLTGDLGLAKAEGKKLFANYHKAVPFAKPTMEMCIQEAQSTGIVRTILNRASRFDLWEPTGYDNQGPALTYDLALRTYGNIERAHTHKALNRKLQGSAADLMKMAMVRCWEEGVFDYTGVPRLTVHDELDFSDPGGKDDGFDYMQHVLETAIPLRIPVKADPEYGPDWGHCA
jgi:DNA polymerase I-like protein with 3'-5' exonuclease and polymerase domains